MFSLLSKYLISLVNNKDGDRVIKGKTKHYSDKKCEICGKYFTPNSPNELTCSSKCKKELYKSKNRRNRRGEKKYHYQEDLKKLIDENTGYSFSEIQRELGNPAANVVDYNIKKVKEQGDVDTFRTKIFKRDKELKGQKIFRVGSYSIKIGYYYHQEYDFEKIVEAAGCFIDGNSEIHGKNEKHLMALCKLAYFYWWTKMLAIRVDERFQRLVENNYTRAYDAISLFFGALNNFKINIALPKGEIPYFSTFTYYLGLAYLKNRKINRKNVRELIVKMAENIDQGIDDLKNKKEELEKECSNEMEGATEKDITTENIKESDDANKENDEKEHSENSDDEDDEEIDYEQTIGYLKMIRDELIDFSKDKFICKNIVQSIDSTLKLDGDPELEFEYIE